MRIAVVGSTGVLGGQVVPRLIEHGHDVCPLVRRDQHLRRFERLGLRAMRADILDAASLERAIRGCDAALHLATAIRLPGPTSDWALNDRIRREGTANLVAACRSVGALRYVQQSIAHLVADGGNSVLDETAPLRPTTFTASAADMESIVANSGLDWIILRGGLFYGPGTDRDECWRQLARTGELRLPGDGSDYISLVHVTDMADAITLAATATSSRLTLSIVDDEPVTYATLFRYIASIEDAPDPRPGGPSSIPSFCVNNARAREFLGWSPRISTYRAGFA
jgi:nucleoside-diphosphate-sugar epimerase